MNCHDRDALYLEMLHAAERFKTIPATHPLIISDRASELLSQAADLIHQDPRNGGCPQESEPLPLVNVRLIPWVEQKYRRWHKRYNLIAKRDDSPTQTFEKYLGDVLKNALKFMHDL